MFLLSAHYVKANIMLTYEETVHKGFVYFAEMSGFPLVKPTRACIYDISLNDNFLSFFLHSVFRILSHDLVNLDQHFSGSILTPEFLSF